MSDRARQLAERVNQHEDECRRKEALQLHKAKILQAKANDFWQKVISALKEEYTDFNDTLREGSAYRIEHFKETRGQCSARLERGFGFALSKVSLDVDAQKITIVGELEAKGGGRKTFDKTVQLNVDDSDNVRLRDGESYLTESDVAIEALKPFALSEDSAV
jgi:hypothetical protein